VSKKTRDNIRETLQEYVSRRVGRRGLYRALKEVYEAYREEKITLVDPDPPRNIIQYLKRIEYSLWFWTTVSIMILTTALVYLTDSVSVLMPLRYVAGSVTVLFLPGYVLVEALYPHEKDLSPLERLALSIGLSLAVVPLIGLVLNYTPWGIRLQPILTSISIYVYALALVAAYRKLHVLKLIKT